MFGLGQSQKVRHHRHDMNILTGVERTFGTDELIVTKTNLKGQITYANEVFCRLADYEAHELLGQPHNLIRHPHMPRCVFKLLWDTIAGGKEIFAYVVNRSRHGDHYWVLAHVTPSFDDSGQIVGYHSNRRVPDPGVIQKVIAPLYDTLRGIEAQHESPVAGVKASTDKLLDILKSKGMNYDAFVFSLIRAG